jgi:hypothetical protein
MPLTFTFSRLDVTTLVRTPTHVTFFGNALINGVGTEDRVDVDDLDEPGRYRVRSSFGLRTGIHLAG